MSGWIKLEKDLRQDPRVLRMARELDRRYLLFSVEAELDPCNAASLPAVALVLGGLTQLWLYADSFARDDDTLDVGSTEIDQLTGIQGFAELMPRDWLEILDVEHVKLPGFHEHNGTEAKRRALTAKRVAALRERNRVTPHKKGVTQGALPDQDQDQDQDQDLKKRLRPTDVVEQKRSTGPVQEVFEHWKTEHGHPKAQLDPKRRRRIADALKHFTAEQLCQAISGYRHSPHHMGTDPKGQGVKYDDIELFLRDGSHIEAGLRFFAHPPRPPPQENASEQILRKLHESDDRVIEHEPEETFSALTRQ